MPVTVAPPPVRGAGFSRRRRCIPRPPLILRLILIDVRTPVILLPDRVPPDLATHGLGASALAILAPVPKGTGPAPEATMAPGGIGMVMVDVG